jgi:hypothetical protein
MVYCISVPRIARTPHREIAHPGRQRSETDRLLEHPLNSLDVERDVIRIFRTWGACLCSLLVAAQVIAAPAPRPDLWIANGPVDAMVSDAHVSGVAAMAASDAALDTSFPRVTGTVYSMVPDGQSPPGWFIGGQFSAVDGVARDNLAHLDSGYALDTAWNISADGVVYTLLRDGGDLYVGGSFTQIGGEAINGLARVSVADGTVSTGWTPAPDGVVRALAVSGDTLYIGGNFKTIDGVTRHRVAALNTTATDAGSFVQAWDPDADGEVRTMLLDGATLYVGGYFTVIDGQTRNRIAALDTAATVAGTIAKAWDPNANAAVQALARSGTILYVSGDFTAIEGKTLNRLAALDTAAPNGSIAFDWNPDPENLLTPVTVSALGLSGSTLYVGGNFTQIDGKTHNHIAALNPDPMIPSGSIALAWAPAADAEIHSLVESDGTVYVAGRVSIESTLFIGGQFDFVAPATGGAAAFDVADGTPSGAFPSVNGTVYAVAADGASGWYIAGDFTAVNGTARRNLAHVLSDDSIDAWDPSPDGVVYALARSGTTLFIGGNFTTVDGQARNRIAAFDTTTGTVNAWDPGLDGTTSVVYALALSTDGLTLFVGGDFSSFAAGTIARNKLAAIDTTTGVVNNAWDPGLDGTASVVYALAPSADGTKLYVGGDFTSVASTTHRYIAALNASTGAVQPWAPDANAPIHSLIVSGTTLYVGGDFTQIAGVARSRVAALDTTASTLIAFPTWNPGAGGAVYALDAAGGTVIAGGAFNCAGGETRRNIAALDIAAGGATAWDPSADGEVRALLLSADGETLYAGGDFTAIGGQYRSHVAALDTASALPTSWAPEADGAIRALARGAAATTLFAGGDFTVIGGQVRQWLAEVRLDTGSTTAWNPALSGGAGVNALLYAGERLYVGGDFLNVGSQPFSYLTAFDTTGMRPTAWPEVHNPNAGVHALDLSSDGATLYVGGDFTTVDGQPHVGVAAVDAADGTGLGWDPQLDGPVYAIQQSVDRTKVYIGGDFMTAGGQSRTRLAALSRADASASAAWAPAVSGTVYALLMDDKSTTASPVEVVYAAGQFRAVEGESRAHLAAFDAIAPETTPPVTTAVPGGATFNSVTNTPVELMCDDAGGSGCAATYFTLDGSEPTDSSDVYVEPIELGADTVLRFYSVDFRGNTETTVHTETYNVETQAPTTTVDPTTRVFTSPDLQVRLTCSDGSGVGCAATYYTVDGTNPTVFSPQYTGPITITDNTMLKFFSVDNYGNVEPWKVAEFVSNRGKVGAVSPISWIVALLFLMLRGTRFGRVRTAR